MIFDCGSQGKVMHDKLDNVIVIITSNAMLAKKQIPVIDKCRC